MNIKQISEQLNQPFEKVKATVKELFSPVPPTFTAEQISQIERHLSKVNSLPTAQNNNSQPDATEQLFTKESAQDRIRRLHQAGSMVGSSEAKAFNAARNDAFLKGVQADDNQIFYDFINGAIQHSLQTSHYARNIDRINGTPELKQVEISEYNQPSDNFDYLKPSEDDQLAKGWQKLLNPGQ